MIEEFDKVPYEPDANSRVLPTQTHLQHLLQPTPNNADQSAESRAKTLISPNLQLTGHGGEVFCVKFSPSGKLLASAGFDKQILLWDVFPHCQNYALLKGHSNAILDLQWSPDEHRIYTASADKSVGLWDAESCKSIKKLKGHSSFVNTVHPVRRGPEILVSGGDDGVLKIWDLREKQESAQFNIKLPVTCVSFDDTAEKLFIGSLDNQVKVMDLRKRDFEYFLYGHTDTITGIALSSDGSYLLSNSMDQTIRCFDVRPFVVKNRCVKIYQGIKHSHDKNLLRVCWSADGEHLSAGSADKQLYVWDSASRKILQKLGGHNGTVNESSFCPEQRIIASASSDRTVIVGYY